MANLIGVANGQRVCGSNIKSFSLKLYKVAFLSCVVSGTLGGSFFI